MKRLFQQLLEEYLEFFPVVAILGVRQCGKTTLANTLLPEWRSFDLEKGSDLELISSDPDLFFRLNSHQVIIDEAQHLPSLFPALRVAIDAHRDQRGRFVITGSSSPELQTSISESLAGRIGILELSPLMWAEVNDGGVSALVHGLAKGQTQLEFYLHSSIQRAGLDEIMAYWFRGGYPEPWLKPSGRFREAWFDQYQQTYLQRDVARLYPGLDQVRFRQLIRLLGGLSGKIINYADLARAIGVSQPTAKDYLDIAHGTFMWRNIPAFSRNATKRVVKHPRGHLRDSGLLHHLMRIPNKDALLDHPQCGASWQSMVTEEILRQFAALGKAVDAYHYRTGAGAEVDLVLEGTFGIVPFEMKFGQRVDARDLRPIRDFMHEFGCPIGFVIHAGEEPRRLDQNIIGMPFSHL
jgi:uncharacterized protein